MDMRQVTGQSSKNSELDMFCLSIHVGFVMKTRLSGLNTTEQDWVLLLSVLQSSRCVRKICRQGTELLENIVMLPGVPRAIYQVVLRC